MGYGLPAVASRLFFTFEETDMSEWLGILAIFFLWPIAAVLWLAEVAAIGGLAAI
jgi:hypothetical protein